MTYGAIIDRKDGYPGMLPIQGIISEDGMGIFIDLCHLNALGNEKVAMWMAEYLYENFVPAPSAERP